MRVEGAQFDLAGFPEDQRAAITAGGGALLVNAGEEATATPGQEGPTLLDLLEG